MPSSPPVAESMSYWLQRFLKLKRDSALVTLVNAPLAARNGAGLETDAVLREALRYEVPASQESENP